MKPLLERPVPMTPWGKAALSAVVLQGVAMALLDPDLELGAWGAAALLVTAGTYVSLGCVEHLRSRVSTKTFLAVQHLLALALPWLGHGRTATAPLAAISLSGLVLPARWAVWPAAVHTLNIAAACTLGMPGPLGRLTVYTVLVAVVFVMAFTEAVTRELRTRERLNAATRKLETQAAQAEQVATLAERARIARELHDSLGHALTAAHVQLRVAERDLPPHAEEVRSTVEAARRALQQGLEELRQTVRTLHAPAARIVALESALRDLLDDRANQLPVALRVEGRPRRLPPPLCLALYRAAQEALTNVVRHARARQAAVTLRYDDAAVELCVLDDGCGLPADVKEGFGLLSMRERIEGLGGRLSLDSQAGLRLTARVPLDHR